MFNSVLPLIQTNLTPLFQSVKGCDYHLHQALSLLYRMKGKFRILKRASFYCLITFHTLDIAHS